MKEKDRAAFVQLFREVLIKCFGHLPDRALTEPESRNLSYEIEARTGLVIGWKTIKNYAAATLEGADGKAVNPSVVTLDTLARYVSNAPVITEAQRKKSEAHYPYWFQYQEKIGTGAVIQDQARPARPVRWLLVVIGGLFFLLLLAFWWFGSGPEPITILEDFDNTAGRQLQERGWQLQSIEPSYWSRRGEYPEDLTLFTLKGDNWPQQGEDPLIRNLLYRRIEGDCFEAEVHFSDFIPRLNWQQAGLLLMEDTTFQGRSIRLSLGYNDFFGGLSQPGQIRVQAIAAYGRDHPNLEEIVQYPVFTVDKGFPDTFISDNMKHSALRIEKQGRRFRFLHSSSPMENFSYKELANYEFDMEPRFIGLFALHGFVDSLAVMPVRLNYFRMDSRVCR